MGNIDRKYKGLVAFDLDHTLLDHNTWKITPSAMDSIGKLKEKGYLVAIASGRDMKNRTSIEYLREVNPHALIHMNGTMVETEDDIILDHRMDKELLRRVLEFCEKHETPIGVHIDDVDYFVCPEKVLFFDKNYFKKDMERHFEDPKKLLKLPVRSLAYYGDRAGGKDLQYAFPELNVMMFSKDYGADVVEAEYSKAEGIKHLCEHFGISLAETYAFGDSSNDVEMLEKVHVGIAMGNAVPEAKEAADYITDDIDKDGIRNALLHFGLI